MKLEEPILIELENDSEFIIVEEIDLSNLKHRQIDLKGNRYNYDDGKMSEPFKTLMVFDLKDNAMFSVGEDGEIID